MGSCAKHRVDNQGRRVRTRSLCSYGRQPVLNEPPRRLGWRGRLSPRVVACCGVFLSMACAVVQAQETWEFSPYQIRIWLVVESTGELPPTLHGDLERELRQFAEIHAGATWKVQVESPPDKLRGLMLRSLSKVTVPLITAQSTTHYESDKLIMLAVSVGNNGYQIQAREIDGRTRHAGKTITRSTFQVRQIAYEAFRAVSTAFAPVARIEEVEGKLATLRPRAMQLIFPPEAENPARIDSNQVFEVIIRRNNRRTGEPRSVNGIEVLPFTYVITTDRDVRVFNSQVHTGISNPFGGRVSKSMERYAIRVRPTGPSTWLQVQSRQEPHEKLAGYDVYSKDVITDDPFELDKQEVPPKLGRTDWRGMVEIVDNDSPIRVIFVKNGERFLAKVPIVPGLEPLVTAETFNDGQRLQAETYVREIQGQVLSLVLQRQIMASRIRQQIEEKNVDGDDSAQELLVDFKKLSSRDDLITRKNEQQNRINQSDAELDRSSRVKIDMLFSKTETLIDKFIDPSLVDTLTTEIAEARSPE